MRKTLLVLFIALLGTSNIFAQAFTFTRFDPYPVYNSPDSFMIKSHAVVHSNSSSNMMIHINVVNVQVPSGWDLVGFCTWETCFGTGHYSDSALLHPGSNDTFYVYFNPNGIQGIGSCTVNMIGGSTTQSQDFMVSTFPVGIKQISSTVKDFSLNQNYPNPFNPSTKIRFTIPKSNYTDLRVYDLLGREVGVLASSYMTAGEYEIDFDGKNLASGMYYYRLQTGDNVAVKKMTLVK